MAPGSLASGALAPGSGTPGAYSGIYCNAQIGSRLLRHFCRLDTTGEQLLRAAMGKLRLSARAHDHILKISRTIADLAVSELIRPEHLAEAIQFRSLDREGWAG
jgi:magnesium chelatase family protein